MDLEEPDQRCCTDCEHYIKEGEYNYDCEPMRQGKSHFCSDSCDTAEGCKQYKFNTTNRNKTS